MTTTKLNRKAIEALTDRLLDARQSNLKMVLDIDHRLQRVKLPDGRSTSFINDAKSTTVAATHYSLNCIEGSIIWLISCKEDYNRYSALRALVHDKVSAILYLGLEDATLAEEFVNDVDMVQRCESMQEMVLEAMKLVEDGETVLYSPAVHSSAYYRTYQKRGEAFIQAVSDVHLSLNPAL